MSAAAGPAGSVLGHGVSTPRVQSSQSYDELIRSLEIAIEQAFAGLASAFSVSPQFSLHSERKRILQLIDVLANLLRDQGDAVLTLPNAASDDDCKERIADLRRQINQITGSNAKIAVQVLNKVNAAHKLRKPN